MKFASRVWNSSINQFDGLFPYPPHISLIEPLAIGNARAIPQQSVAVLSNIDDLESYLAKFNSIDEKPLFEAVDLPAANRKKVLRDLEMMGITSASLFPGLDGACEALREHNFW